MTNLTKKLINSAISAIPGVSLIRAEMHPEKTTDLGYIAKGLYAFLPLFYWTTSLAMGSFNPTEWSNKREDTNPDIRIEQTYRGSD